MNGPLSVVVVVAVGIAERYRQIHSRAGSRSGSGGQRTIDHDALRIVIGEAVRSPEHRQGAVRVFVEAPPGAHEVLTQRQRRDLQAEPLPLDGVVVADDALFLDAEDLAPGLGGIGDEGGALLLRHREAGIVLGQIDRGQPAVGRRDAGDASALEFLRQPVLQRPEGPLGAAACLRRMCCDRPSLAPDNPAWSDSKTGQITRYKFRTDDELTTFSARAVAIHISQYYHSQNVGMVLLSAAG